MIAGSSSPALAQPVHDVHRVYGELPSLRILHAERLDQVLLRIAADGEGEPQSVDELDGVARCVDRDGPSLIYS